MLISIKSLVERAKAAGFEVNGGSRYAEMWAPNNSGPRAIYSGDSCYSTADIVIDDRSGIGYGYNDCFYGPWHTGMTQDTAFGVRKLLTALGERA
jgi:hypothetical protein